MLRSVVLVLALAACERAPAGSDHVAEAGEGCSAEATLDWAPAEGVDYVISGASVGDQCEAAELVFKISDAESKEVLYERRYAAQDLPVVFGEVRTSSDMKAALSGWIDPKQNSSFNTTADLPEWAEGADSPGDAAQEFPFYPEEGLTQAAYAQLRAQGLPMLCHVQGSESMACFAVGSDGVATPVGLQTFPG